MGAFLGCIVVAWILLWILAAMGDEICKRLDRIAEVLENKKDN